MTRPIKSCLASTPWLHCKYGRMKQWLELRRNVSFLDSDLSEWSAYFYCCLNIEKESVYFKDYGKTNVDLIHLQVDLSIYLFKVISLFFFYVDGLRSIHETVSLWTCMGLKMYRWQVSQGTIIPPRKLLSLWIRTGAKI